MEMVYFLIGMLEWMKLYLSNHHFCFYNQWKIAKMYLYVPIVTNLLETSVFN